jgi:protein SCO1/2
MTPSPLSMTWVALIALSLTTLGCGGEEAHDHSHCDTAQANNAQAEHAGHGEHAMHAAEGEGAQDALDGQSLFHLDEDLSLVDQAGEPFPLRSLEARPTLITFFYGGCTTMCPLIISDVRRIVDAMPATERAGVNVVLVTIDPARDTPERLRELAAERSIPAEWRLVGGDAASIRTLASTLGMSYRPLPDGSFAHGALFTALDGEGRVVRQIDGLGRPIEELSLALRPRS